MPVNVGNSLNIHGRPYLVTTIEKRTAQGIAPESSVEMEASLRSQQNVRFLKIEFGSFEAGDIINTECEWCTLEAKGDVQFIYTKYIVHKEGDTHGQNGRAQDVNEAAGSPSQAVDERPAGGTDPRPESVG